MKALVFFFVLVLSALPVQAQQWEPVDGPYGGTSVGAMATMADGAVLAGTLGGIFRRNEVEDEWEPYGEGLVVTDTRALVTTADGTTWAALFGDGIRKRKPGEDTWARTGLSGTFSTSLAVDATTGTLFAGTVGGLLRSTDGGDNWTETARFDTLDLGTQALAHNGDFLFAGTAQGIYRSDDQGDSWELIGFGMTNFNVTALIARPGGLAFAGTSTLTAGCNLFRTRNNGNLWNCVEPNAVDPLEVRALAFAPDGRVFAGGFRTTNASTDEGSSWVTNVVAPTRVNAFAFTETAVWGGTAGRGVVAQQGGVWAEANTGLLSTITALRIAADGTVFIGTDGGVYRSSDRGATWDLINTGLDNLSVRTLAFDGDTTLYAGTFGGVFRRDPLTDEWTLLGPPSTPGIRDLAVGAEGRVYAGFFEGIFEYTPSSGTWVRRVLTGPDEATRDVISVALGPDGTLYAGAFFDTFRLEADGTTWTQLSYRANDRDNIFSGQDLFVEADGTLCAGTRFWSVLCSTDQGATWTRLVGGLSGLEDMRALVRQPDGPLCAGTFGSGVLCYDEAAETWRPVNEGLANLRAVALGFDADGRAYAGTFGGGLYRHNALSIAAEPLPALPQQLTLHGAYPNPFNPTTTLRFTLPEAAQVHLAVFDLLGRRVVTQGPRPAAAGTGVWHLDASGLASGSYFYRLTAQTPTARWHATGSLILAK